MYTTPILALMLATAISLFATVLLSFVVPVPVKTLLAVGGVTFFVSFLATLAGFRYLLLTKANKISKKINELLPEKENTHKKTPPFPASDLLTDIYERVDSFVNLKQGEVSTLKKREAFRAEFIADVSHELKTPIFAAQGFIYTLLDGAINDENVRIKFLKKAAKNLDGLNILVQDLLTLSQIEMGNVKMKVDNIDLYRLCVEVVEQFEQRGVRQPIPIIIVPPPSAQLIIVRADWLRIVQVMTNLISNAIKYTDEKGSITIRFDIEKGFVTTSVTDTGVGIPTVHLDRIFQRFYRVDKSRSKQRGGTGLGLSIVKHILEGHNTTVQVKSTVGQGSTFSFKLRMAGLPHQASNLLTG